MTTVEHVTLVGLIMDTIVINKLTNSDLVHVITKQCAFVLWALRI